MCCRYILSIEKYLSNIVMMDKKHASWEMAEGVWVNFGKAEADAANRLPQVFHNRVDWAKTHWKMSSLLENVCQGVYRIAEMGVAVLPKL